MIKLRHVQVDEPKASLYQSLSLNSALMSKPMLILCPYPDYSAVGWMLSAWLDSLLCVLRFECQGILASPFVPESLSSQDSERNKNLKSFRVFLVLRCPKLLSKFPGRQHQMTGSLFLRTSLLKFLTISFYGAPTKPTQASAIRVLFSHGSVVFLYTPFRVRTTIPVP